MPWKPPLFVLPPAPPFSLLTLFGFLSIFLAAGHIPTQPSFVQLQVSCGLGVTFPNLPFSAFGVG